MTDTTVPATQADEARIDIEHHERRLSINEKDLPGSKHIEQISSNDGNLHYDEVDKEPELHARTYVAIAAMFLLNMVQVIALNGPPAVLSYIGAGLDNTVVETWVPNALSLVQAALCPVISSASDTFQARKMLLVGTSTISFIGAAIAPGSENMYRLIAAQALIGFGFAAVPLAYAVPSEIVPRKWRPLVQAIINVAAYLGAMIGPLAIGAFTRADPIDGWRKFYWLQTACWGITAVCIFFGYRPPKRHTRLDHLSFWQKLSHLDLPGFTLLTAGLILTLVGLNLGGTQYPWTDGRVLATLIIGILTLALFGIYEWKGTSVGILHHDLFRGGKSQGHTFAICVGLILVEAIFLFASTIFYPILTTLLFEKDPFLLVVRSLPATVAGAVSTLIWGYLSTKFKTIRGFLFAGFLIMMGSSIGFAAIQPNGNITELILSGLFGIGFGAPLILIIVGVQLSTPHRLIATATAVATSARAVAATVFTAIFSAAFNSRVSDKVPSYTAAAAIGAGLPLASVPAFVQALVAGNTAVLVTIPGVSPTIVAASLVALRQAFADSIRVVYIIAAPFGVVACIACLFLGNISSTMNYKVDAPVEDLGSKKNHDGKNPQAIGDII